MACLLYTSRVDAIVQKNGGDLRAPMRIKGALFWALEDSKGKNGHLFLTSEALQKEADVYKRQIYGRSGIFESVMCDYYNVMILSIKYYAERFSD